MYSFFTALYETVIVHYYITTWRHLVIKSFQRNISRLVHISIQPKQSKLLNRRGIEGFVKPSRDKSDLFIQQIKCRKILFNLIETNCKFLVLVQSIARISLPRRLGWR